MAATFKNYFSANSDAYTNYRPKYPLQLVEQLAKLCSARAIALDCGFGQLSTRGKMLSEREILYGLYPSELAALDSTVSL
jgi:hypothetical protein